MISLRGVTFTYPGAGRPALDRIDLDVPEGDLVLVAGASGSGKSTLLRTFNGLVPQHSGGTFAGRVLIAGDDVTGRPPRDLAHLVGFVPQDPWAHATADRVTPELAFALENLGTPVPTMRKRIEEVLDQLGLSALRERRLDTLSGGERQRVAIAAVLATLPRVIVLDEPTSNLDPASAEDVLAALVRLRDDLGLTIVLSEHRLERVAGAADRVVFLDGRSAVSGTPREVLRTAPFAPPVTMLGRRLGWDPLPLTVREGRRFARDLRAVPPDATPAMPRNGAVIEADDLRCDVLRGASLTLHPGELAALVGRNGAGKTTLLRTIVGLAQPRSGRVRPSGSARDRARTVAYLPQRAEAVLYRETLRGELPDVWIDRLTLRAHADDHPWELSAGERLRAAIGTALARPAAALLLDEPTRGLDPDGKALLVELLRERTREGAAVLLVTHDVELVAAAAQRVLLLAEGQIVADGPTREILGESLLFSSQTSKVMGDPRFLVPDDVRS